MEEEVKGLMATRRRHKY